MSSIENRFDKSVELELELEKSGKIELLEEIRKISDMVNIHYVKRSLKDLNMQSTVQRAILEMNRLLFDIVRNDKPCLKRMIEAYDEYKTSILGVQEV